MHKKQLISITVIVVAALTIGFVWGILIEPSDEIIKTNAQAILGVLYGKINPFKKIVKFIKKNINIVRSY